MGSAMVCFFTCLTCLELFLLKCWMVTSNDEELLFLKRKDRPVRSLFGVQ